MTARPATTRFFPLPAGRPLRIEVRGTLPERRPEIEPQWASACASNPKLFDGPILSVTAIDPASGVIAARLERFAHLVCTPSKNGLVPTILSVTGVIESVSNGRRCVLLARRGEQTRSYPGQWEFAPSGGLHPVVASTDLAEAHVYATLRAELREEAGIEAPLRNRRVVGLVTDPAASSVDVVVRATVAGEAPRITITGEHAWESSDARWVPIEDLETFLSSAIGGVIEPTLAIGRWFAWLG